VIGNQIPYHLPSSFFWLRFFFGVNFCGQTPGTCLHHTVLLVGVTDPGNFGVFIFESLVYLVISTFSNAHNFVKNLVWTSFYNPFWGSWADLSFAPTFSVWRKILFSASGYIKATVSAWYSDTKFKFSTYYNLVPRYVRVRGMYACVDVRKAGRQILLPYYSI
jgi:hypothetical protein